MARRDGATVGHTPRGLASWVLDPGVLPEHWWSGGAGCCTLFPGPKSISGDLAALMNDLYQLHNDGSIWSYTGKPLTGWELLDNNPAAKMIACNSTGAYQLHIDGTIWLYTGPPLSGWQLLDNNPRTISITADGINLYQLHNDGTIWVYTGPPMTGWQMLDNNPRTIAVVAAGGHVYQLHNDGTIWVYIGPPMTGWQVLDNNPRTRSVVANASELYQLHNDGTIWRYTGPPMTGWQMLDNNPRTESIAAAGKDVYQLHNDGTIWVYTGPPMTGWEMLDNNPRTDSITASGSALYQHHNDGTIWRYTGPPLTGWELLDNNPRTIAIASPQPDVNVTTNRNNASRLGAYLAETQLRPDTVRYDGSVWRYTGPPITGWEMVDNNPRAVSSAASESHLYQLHDDGTIWLYTGPPITGWQLLDNNPATVAIATDGPSLYQLHNDGSLWIYTGPPISGWQMLDNNPRTQAIAASGGRLYQLHTSSFGHGDGAILHYTGTPISGWETLDSNSRAVSIVAAGGKLYQLHDDGTIWLYTSPPLTGWQLLDNNPRTVAIAAAGASLYQLHDDGTIWMYTGTPLTGWQMLDNNPRAVSIVAAGSSLYQLHQGAFGKLYERTVEGDVMAQPLYLRGVRTGSGPKNLMFVATSTNHVYAFDFDNRDPNPSAAVVWQRQLQPWRVLDASDICAETIGTVGITSTPVIDVAAGTMFVVTRKWTTRGAADDGINFLHAIDVSNGSERPGSPVQIQAEDPHNSSLHYDSRVQRQRPGLLLLNGVVYLGFATFSCDQGAYHGWVLGYRASDLAQVGVFCTSSDGGGAGIWQSGSGLVGAPDGSIWFETGNETLPAAQTYGDSFFRLRATASPPGLELASNPPFRPSNHALLKDGDTDLGSGGPILLPGGRLIGGGKQGRYYVLDAYTMQLTQDQTASDPANVGEGFQAFRNTWHPEFSEADYARGETFGPNIHGCPIYWQGTGYVYQMPEKDFLKAFAYDRHAGTVQQIPVRTASVRPTDGMPGGFSSISANGDRDGIVWTIFPNSDGQWIKVPGTMVAFDATTLEEIWRDPAPEAFSKFCPPTIADGKVVRPTSASNVEAGRNSGKIIVYGLR